MRQKRRSLTMSEWKKLNSRDVYVIVAEDISDSLQRYFAPVLGLIGGVGRSLKIADADRKRIDQAQQDTRARPS
jgi:hypothetical protein